MYRIYKKEYPIPYLIEQRKYKRNRIKIRFVCPKCNLQIYCRKYIIKHLNIHLSYEKTFMN